MRSLISVGAAFLLAAAAPGAQGASWDYSPTSQYGPHNWDNTEAGGHADCKLNEQSPINIGAVNVDTTLRPLNRQWDNKTIIAGAKLKNNGHAIKMDFQATEGQQPLKLTDPNQNGKEYEMIQFHFHAPSEHTFGGALRDMEVHMVHQAADGTFLVLGVTFIASPNGASNFLNSFWDLLPALDYSNGGALPADQTTIREVDMSDVLPPSMDFFNYNGSFTTPPCTEGVKWYVMDEPVHMSTKQLEAYQKTMHLNSSVWNGVSEFYARGTNRPVLPLNGRTVRRFATAAAPVMDAAAAQQVRIDANAIATNVAAQQNAKKSNDSDDAPAEIIVMSALALFFAVIGLVVGAIAMAKAGAAKPTA